MDDDHHYEEDGNLKRKRSRPPLDWSEAEDAILYSHIELHGPKKWSLVSQALDGSKTANQCRLRWHAINPERCNEPFTEEANAHILQFVDDAIASNNGVRPKKMKWADLRQELKHTIGKCWSTLDISRQYEKLTGGGVAVGARVSPSPGTDGEWQQAIDPSSKTPITPPLFHQESSPSSADEGTRDPSSNGTTPAAGDVDVPEGAVPMAPDMGPDMGAVPMAPPLFYDGVPGGTLPSGGAVEGVGGERDAGASAGVTYPPPHEDHVAAAAGVTAEDTTFAGAAAEAPPDDAISLDSFDWDVLDTALSYGGEGVVGATKGGGSSAVAAAARADAA